MVIFGRQSVHCLVFLVASRQIVGTENVYPIHVYVCVWRVCAVTEKCLLNCFINYVEIYSCFAMRHRIGTALDITVRRHNISRVN